MKLNLNLIDKKLHLRYTIKYDIEIGNIKSYSVCTYNLNMVYYFLNLNYAKKRQQY